MKEKAATKKNEAPVFKLQAFGEKPTWTDFYIQNLKAHIKDHSFVNKPHKHDFYLIMYVTKGSGVHSIDFVDYEVEPNRMFLMTPGQVHTWELSDETEGFIIFFTRDFYQLRLTDNNLLDFPFFHSLVASPLIHIAEQEVVIFTLKQMKLEYERSGQPDLRLIRAYLDLMLLEVAKYYDVSKTVQTRRVFTN